MLFPMSRPGFVTRFKEERAAFVYHLEYFVETLKADPLAAGQVAEALSELVQRVHSLREAAVAMDANTRAHQYVKAKPYAFYSHNVPLMCNDIVASLLHWADILVNTDGRRTDGIVVHGIERMLASLEF